ncbi:prepilin peptidase [Acidocella facilis]|uniref:prepilin peptidase n=1 Tax=Acidocella facilis TaxID=525 RepID=UPI000556AC34|nr:A24 family peptidase [Acidocella facilis]
MITALFGLGLALLVYAAVHDVAVRTVPNSVSALVLLTGFGLRLLEHDLLPALLAALLVFIALFGIWALGLMGGGDVKLWAATTLLVPPGWLPQLMFLADVMLLGGILGLLYLFLSFVVGKPAASRAGSRLARALRTERWRIRRRGPLPYACAIAGGAFVAILPRFFET